MTDPTDALATLEEPVAESAPLAHRLAAALCAIDPATGETCAWYHGVWQYLRALGLAKASGGQTAFLLDTLSAFARRGDARRVLVSGSGDYSMPAHALRAYGRAAAALELTVLDRCETPLALTRWYAEREGVQVATDRADILDYRASSPFDVVLANSFLGYFDEGGRRRLAAAWWRLLRPGGAVVLTNRLRPGAGPAPVGFSPAEARGFAEAARRAAEGKRLGLGLDPETVLGWAQTYAERFRSHPLRSADAITGLLSETGFDLDRMEVAGTPGRPGGEAVSGPSMAEKAEYVRVIATRR